MAEQPKPPILNKPIPSLITNEGGAFGPVDFKNYIKTPNTISGPLRFTAELSDGRPFPAGLICTQDGLFSGIAAVGTAGTYEVLLSVENDSKKPLLARFRFTIKARMGADEPDFLTNLKSQVWQALGENLPIPELGQLLDRPVTAVEMYYLLERFGILTIWDIYNLEAPTDKVLLSLEGMSEHYHIYDRSSCIIGAPKDLFSHERTLEDALQTARVLAREAYKRGWAVELVGYNKMARAAWVELQLLGDKHGKQLEILHYSPSLDDVKIYTVESKANRPSV